MFCDLEVVQDTEETLSRHRCELFPPSRDQHGVIVETDAAGKDIETIQNEGWVNSVGFWY